MSTSRLAETLHAAPSRAAADVNSLAATICTDHETQRISDQLATDSRRTVRHLSFIAKNMAMSGALAVGAWLVISGGATVGIMMGAGILMARIIGPVEMFLDERLNIVAAWRGWKQIRGLAKPARIEIAEPTASQMPVNLRVLGVTLWPSFDGDTRGAFQFDLHGGQVLSVLSANGQGKTSLLKTLSGETEPASGRIALAGKWLHGLPSRELSRLVGYLPQESVFLPGTITQIVSRFGDLSRDHVVDVCKRVGLHDFIGSWPHGYETMIMPRQTRLSYSVLRRLALARAIAASPRLLLLDEPFAGMDGMGCKLVLDIIKAHRDSGGIAIVASQGSLPPEVADLVLTIVGGRMRSFGSPESAAKPQSLNSTALSVSADRVAG
jgi:ABC-type protease/lipase transport system fused ATPase/permease subunit